MSQTTNHWGIANTRFGKTFIAWQSAGGVPGPDKEERIVALGFGDPEPPLQTLSEQRDDRGAARRLTAIIDTGHTPALAFNGTRFQRQVWADLLTIPRGQTCSYGDIAQRIGCNSARAVGQAVGANPIALLIPCHRVIQKTGGLGGYHWGLGVKRKLLAWEGVPGH